MEIGVLHPGQMGASVGAVLVQRGGVVCWAGDGRSADSRARAEAAGLVDLVSLEAVSGQCPYLLSVCPPERAVELAERVAGLGFGGVYVDCNAISPGSSREIERIFSSTSASYVDGAIIGPPVVNAGTTRLYLCGELALEIAALFAGSPLQACVLNNNIGCASALKMAYAGWTKGSAALLMSQYALAEQQNVAQALLDEWAISLPGLSDQLHAASLGNAPKAWRFVGEMHEIAKTLDESGLTREWFDAAAKTYQRLSRFKDRSDLARQEVIAALNRGTDHD